MVLISQNESHFSTQIRDSYTMDINIGPNVTNILQTLFYVVSPLVTLLAVSVAYIALIKQSRPHILIQYRPNPNIGTLIDLVIENLGSGLARNVKFSRPLPVNYFGNETADDGGIDILSEGLPAIAAGQHFIFCGGQFGGLNEKLQQPLEIQITYEYRNPLGIKRTRKETCILSVAHIRHMPSRDSAEHAIVDALKGPNTTTLQRIQRELANISRALGNIVETQENENTG
tara:strand:+ start:7165 stop:7854 length:690 start_codon:yes stop_codon:yes gene_type:complete